MKNSGIDWIGMIPDDWKVVKLGDICKIQRGKQINKVDMLENGTYPVYSSQTTNDGIIGYLETYMIDGEYVTYTSDGAKAGTVFYRNGKFNYTTHCGVLIPKVEYNTRWLHAVLQSCCHLAVKKTMFGGQVNNDAIAGLDIPLPPLDQQELIAGYLDEQSRKQSLLKHSDLITQLKNYKVSIISEYITGKKSLDNKPVVMKDSGIDWIGEIPAHWEVKSIADYASVYSGKGIKKDEYADNGTYPIIGANGEIGRCEQFNNDHTVLTTGRVGTLGTVHRVDKCWISDNTLIIDTNNNGISINYLEHYMKCLPYSELRTGTAQPLMTATKIKECWLVVPPLSEQEAIAAKLDAVITEVDSVVANSEKIVAELKAYKSAVITEFITGQKLVPGYDSNIAERESR